ncbi:TPA: LPD7 domain-containing protein [Klebsiella aerogenes]
MLIRQYGANDGIKDYLLHGIKNGRDFSRDELDERIVLSGDLDITDAVIKAMSTTTNERYNHYTLSFAEDHISPELAREIAQEFKTFALSAYRDDEVCYYAEMHNPRIKSYTNKATGESVERKPHIHIVVPKMNLASGTYLNPFGLLKQNIKFMDAFQEHINLKYDLVSPKDRRRTSLVDGGDMLSRYKADLFNPGNKEVKAQLLSLIIDRNVKSTEELSQVAAELGEVKVRNADKDNAYLNIKLKDAPKGINLKDYPFSKDFLALPLSEKIKQVEQGDFAGHSYKSGAEPKKTASDINEILSEWHSTRAREIRFVGASVYKAYKSSTPLEQAEMLIALEQRFYQKYKGEFDVGNELNVSNRSGQRKRNHDEIPPQKRGDLRWLSKWEMVRKREEDAMLLQNDVRDNLANGGDSGRDDVRRLSGRIEGAGERRVVSGPQQLLVSLEDIAQDTQKNDQPDIKEIRLNLDAARLLAALAQTHGIDTRKYAISKGKDGADRIVCGKRKYTVNDFLTKELHLGWKDAEQILRLQYDNQKSASPYQRPVLTPKSELWREYLLWVKAHESERSEAWAEQREREKSRRASIRGDFKRSKGAVWADRSLTRQQKRGRVSVINMEKAIAEKELAQRIEKERLALNKKWMFMSKDRYYTFLQEEAEKGNEVALAELRRVTPDPNSRFEENYSNVSGSPDQEQEPTLVKGRDYRVRRNGDVHYNVNGHSALVDAGKWVRVITDSDDDAVELAIRLALEKNHFRALNITGSESFKNKVAEVVAKRGIRAQFSDAEMNEKIEALKPQSKDKDGQKKSRTRDRRQSKQRR